MIILFSPSEGKREGGTFPPLNQQSLIFPDLYTKRLEVIEQYELLIQNGSDEDLYELFGIKDPQTYSRYRKSLTSTPTMKAIERYDGVAYDYLDYPHLSLEAKGYIDTHTILFSNLFGPLKASDLIPDYKLKQGSSIGEFIPDKHYKNHFSAALDAITIEDEILDLRAGYYDKFYVPIKPIVTLKFLKNGKVVSHWAKAYRGIVLRTLALNSIQNIDAFMKMEIEGLSINEIQKKGKQTEIIYNILI